MNHSPPKQLRPFIIYANWFQFGRGEKISRKHVESRMLLWVVRGRGEIIINGESFQVSAGQWFFLPWGHQLEYHASENDPFLLGGIHLIPRYDATAPLRFHVAHDPGDPLAGSPSRLDDDLGDLNGLIQGRFANEQERLPLFCGYLIQSFEARANQVSKLAQCAQLLIEEISLACHQFSAQPVPVPSTLFRAETYARKHLQEKLQVATLARAGNCSSATLHRLFRQYRNQSPGDWLACQRAARAAQLLRTTSLKIQEIAPLVGMPDPFQFSRFFKRMKGISPKSYRSAKAVF